MYRAKKSVFARVFEFWYKERYKKGGQGKRFGTRGTYPLEICTVYRRLAEIFSCKHFPVCEEAEMTISEMEIELEKAKKEIEGLSLWSSSYPRLMVKIESLERDLKNARVEERQARLF